MCGFLALSILTVAGIAGASAANAMTLTSLDIKPRGKIADEQVFNGWDCTGKNVSPALAWSDAPKGTKSFAVSVFDSDAPTGSGFLALVGGRPFRRRDRPAKARGERRRAAGRRDPSSQRLQPDGLRRPLRRSASRAITISPFMLSTPTSSAPTPPHRAPWSASTCTATRRRRRP